MKNSSLWGGAVSLAIPVLSLAQANPLTASHPGGLSDTGVASPQAAAPAKAPSSVAPAARYQSSLASYVRAASSETSADKAWLPANRFVRDVDQMNMGAGNPGPADMQSQSAAAPSSGPTAASVASKPVADHAHAGMPGMGH